MPTGAKVSLGTGLLFGRTRVGGSRFGGAFLLGGTWWAQNLARSLCRFPRTAVGTRLHLHSR